MTEDETKTYTDSIPWKFLSLTFLLTWI